MPRAGSARHNLSFGVQGTLLPRDRQPQADNNAAVGTGNIFTLPALPEAPTFQDPYINRTERGAEFFAFDAIQWTQAFQTWLGVRHSAPEARKRRHGRQPEHRRIRDHHHALDGRHLAAGSSDHGLRELRRRRRVRNSAGTQPIRQRRPALLRAQEPANRGGRKSHQTP
ncbi:hypothetical protein [Acidovorax sp.]|uniref:hypothetical protein n=1 Tax=Acidovorax sp. TaxID=1872122 RepID=UPI002ACE4E2B|nr:hypothetical protein [Acidovorax sp.]MDZ7862358.1 hypothetical protein [Acidovorax sp.]